MHSLSRHSICSAILTIAITVISPHTATAATFDLSGFTSMYLSAMGSGADIRLRFGREVRDNVSFTLNSDGTGILQAELRGGFHAADRSPLYINGQLIDEIITGNLLLEYQGLTLGHDPSAALFGTGGNGIAEGMSSVIAIGREPASAVGILQLESESLGSIALPIVDKYAFTAGGAFDHAFYGDLGVEPFNFLFGVLPFKTETQLLVWYKATEALTLFGDQYKLTGDTTAIPEPLSAALLTASLMGAGILRKKKVMRR